MTKIPIFDGLVKSPKPVRAVIPAKFGRVVKL